MVLTYSVNNKRFFVEDHSYIGDVRRGIKQQGLDCGFEETQLDRLARATTELATNLVKHAGKGEILANTIATPDGAAIDLISIDRGPGICDIERAMQDGVSTCGTLGGGLGALSRVASRFEVLSTPGQGTSICMRIPARSRAAEQTSSNFDIGAISAPHPDENLCGDTACIAINDKLASVLVVDALGHGCEASASAVRIAERFNSTPFADPVQLVQRMHADLAGQRGAALALTCFDLLRSKVEFVGVGNISARIFTRHDSQGCCSSRGTVGSNLCTLNRYEYDWPVGATMLLYSDGIKSQANIPNSRQPSALALASCVYRDFRRESDDATVVVIKDLRD